MLEAVKFIETKGAYRCLPKDFTRNTLVNKTYKSVNSQALMSRTARDLTGLCSTAMFYIGEIGIGLGMGMLSALNHIIGKSSMAARAELKPAIKEIRARAKNINNIRNK